MATAKCFHDEATHGEEDEGGTYGNDAIRVQDRTADSLSTKVYEPLLVVGLDKFAGLDIRVRVSGGGHTSQI